ncbi:hypothetical protein ACHAXA_000842 [Cyclostephanos tholiformis]|uniref:HSF-type DNA-binding domain-containing protein n=1 Tax=Cyclostephanos tholiformis TaxID=382380 RepID=A0ABD3SQK9_9STRA
MILPIKRFTNDDMSSTSMNKHFPFRLYDMLEYVSTSENSSAISWTHDGLAFVINQEDIFLEHVVPMFFNQTKFRSFTRQLSLWGFRRLNARNTWFNQYFIRGSVEGLKYIKRVEVKTSDPSKKGPPERRPTFDSSELKRVTTLRIASLREMSTKNSPSPEEEVSADSMASFPATSILKTGYEIDDTTNTCSDQISEVTMPYSEAALERYRQIIGVTMLNDDAVLVQALKIHQQHTQPMVLPPIKSRLVEKKLKVAVPMTAPPFLRRSIIRTAEQPHRSAVSMLPFSHLPDNDSRDPEHQQKAEVTVFQHTLPTFVYTTPAPFAENACSDYADNSSVQENAPHKSFSSSSSWPQVNANGSNLRVPSSYVGQGITLSGGQVHQSANDDTNDNFPLLASQILESSDDISCDGDLCSVLGLSSNDLKEECMHPISF